MLDVIVYGFDPSGTLILMERKFFSLRGLAFFFATSQAARWEWAEVEHIGGDGEIRIVRYSAEQLRSMIQRPNQHPSSN